MPVCAVNLSERLLDPILDLVGKGAYKNLESFLEIAAYNQLALERAATPEQLLARGHRDANGLAVDTAPAVPPNGHAETARPKSHKSKKKQQKKGGKTAHKSEPAPPTADVDAVLGRWVVPAGQFPPPVEAEGLPAGGHIWGQVNRLFPLKLACRWLARTAAGGSWPAYLVVADGLADDATMVSAVLEQWDLAAGRTRDEILATGLPRRGNSSSRDRFLSQYLARVTRGGEVQSGAICHYALAACGPETVALTAAGLEFARLQNPILDLRDPDSTATLSAGESGFLCRQIKERVAGERQDMTPVLEAVAAGQATPSAVAAAVRGRFPAEWSEVVFRTHLSGLVARLADLRLLHRRWEGRHVQYGLGEAAQAFLN
jgi:hypothetical protein